MTISEIPDDVSFPVTRQFVEIEAFVEVEVNFAGTRRPP